MIKVRPGVGQTGIVLLVGIVGILLPGVQPIVLAALLAEQHLDLAQLGQAASAELLAMGLAASLAAAFLPPRHLRLIGAGAALSLAVANGATPTVWGDAVILLRALSGASGGLLIWITVCLIARSASPERWAGIYLTLQTLSQFGVAEGMSRWVQPRWGAHGDFAMLAALSVVAVMAAPFLPRAFAPLPPPVHAAGSALPSPRGVVGLSVNFLLMMFIVSIWVYYDPIARQAGLGPEVSAQAVALSLICQVLGGLAATLLAGRLRWYPTLMVCGFVELGLICLLGSHPTRGLFLLNAGLFGFLWLFLLPFMVPLLIEADPSRRAAVISGGVALLGGSLGPTLTALLVSPDDIHGALLLGAGCLLLCLSLASGLRWLLKAAPRKVHG